MQDASSVKQTNTKCHRAHVAKRSLHTGSVLRCSAPIDLCSVALHARRESFRSARSVAARTAAEVPGPLQPGAATHDPRKCNCSWQLSDELGK